MLPLYKKHGFIALFYLFLLAGCSSHSLKHTPTDTNYKHVNELKNWHIKGKLAFKSPQDKFSANLNWVYQDKNYQLKLLTFLGTSIFTLESQSESKHKPFKLDVEGEQYFSDNVDELIWSITGRHLPISDLPTLIKGDVAIKNKTSKQYIIERNELGQLNKLTFTDNNGRVWQIHYLTYAKTNGLLLPTNIKLRSSDISVKIAISEWII
ncbi:lipoprotein insertase outer membrane protein LolB [Flocculibacter collagenilyticus]|uniref:lipoprotein insertase outer membrane protein LolB n=1 Tax=Flocculibacter collagenilyticus TaxID=2744479 RepID=UPI0018F3800B|nr:lipoprotein insertase outer membrane protein LolB [Flocculibacter collagenilyticus]